jgi:molybdenum cofactor cytidylyltransferase
MGMTEENPQADVAGTERIFAAVLGAGASSRFGPASKVDAALGGIALGAHVTRLLGRFDWCGRAVVVREDAGAFAAEARSSGFAVILNPDTALGMAQSLRLAVLAARDAGAEGLLVALADMPFVTAAHIERLAAAFAPAAGRTLIATGHGEARAGPPAIFGAGHFDRLLALKGDAGARGLFRTEGSGTILIPAGEREITDIDTPGDLGRAG